MFKKITMFIKKYFVDIIIQFGIYILTNEYIGLKSNIPNCDSVNRYTPIYGDFSCYSSSAIHSAQLKIFAIMLISIGINIAIRKYYHSKKV